MGDVLCIHYDDYDMGEEVRHVCFIDIVDSWFVQIIKIAGWIAMKSPKASPAVCFDIPMFQLNFAEKSAVVCRLLSSVCVCVSFAYSFSCVYWFFSLFWTMFLVRIPLLIFFLLCRSDRTNICINSVSSFCKLNQQATTQAYKHLQSWTKVQTLQSNWNFWYPYLANRRHSKLKITVLGSCKVNNFNKINFIFKFFNFCVK